MSTDNAYDKNDPEASNNTSTPRDDDQIQDVMREDVLRSAAKGTTGAGNTGVEHLREGERIRTDQTVRDATAETPSGADPFLTTAEKGDDEEDAEPPRVVDEMAPSYEADQGDVDPSTGGSTDPHNTLTHANSGDEAIRTSRGELL